ncbi:hypothetical protein [Actinoplanes awajinensis]|uniref:Leucine rich repeat variant n=1 Tax=Actinoplanes awajinensis subsp. mycoplanecinus TaxID=135947 RepID=A0A101JQT2_9ACTN|nr:hypothetical protein [Actinoplanes awajinensis]KUL31253.1 hypothetical protein ADL15_22640 [Actinoplanes awajinensis subsp. mycoplanecinus]
MKRHWPALPEPDAVLEGLAVNPALPGPLLLRLIAEHSGAAADGLAEREPLPATAVTAMAGHPDPWVRAALAGNRSVAAEIRLRLHDDPDPLVRQWIQNVRDLPRPESALSRILERYLSWSERGMLTDPELIGELMEEATRDRRLVALLTRHPDDRFRTAACVFGSVDPDLREILLRDRSATVRSRMAAILTERARPSTAADLDGIRGMRRGSVLTAPLSPELLARVLAEGDEDDLAVLTYNDHLPPEAVAALLAHPLPAVRRAFAGRRQLTAAQAVRLGADPDPSVRTAVSLHPVLTEEQLSAIDIDPGSAGSDRHYPKPSREVLARWATSVNPLLRRRAAEDSRLPAALAAGLAGDTDREVRMRVGRFHPAVVPPALMLESYLDRPHAGRCGCGIRMLRHADFPVAGLARFATHDSPAVRLLATYDPQADPALLEDLLTDPDQEVRRAAARSRHLPVARIVALLDEPELRGFAAANPALPVTEMARRLELPRLVPRGASAPPRHP